jgi:carboxyl-terminal processing protease
LQDNQGAVRITVARWLTPKERQIHEVGLTPDVIVEITQEDVDADRDPQLEKAIEILTK